MVLSFTVTDNKGKYVNGLKPSDFRIMEDGIKEKLSTFSEGNRPAIRCRIEGRLALGHTLRALLLSTSRWASLWAYFDEHGVSIS